jgi:hypothetical protein
MAAFNAERDLKSGSPDHSSSEGMPPETGTDQAVGAGH